MRILLLILFAFPSFGATYYVRTNGSDVADGSLATPWRTIQKAVNTISDGDTALIGHGDFGEYVATFSHASSFKFFRAETNWTASTRQLWVKHRNHWFSGLKIDKTIDTDPANQNGAHVRIDPAGSFLVLSNNWISDTPLLYARFHITTNGTELIFKITNSTANFLSSNFVVGGHIFAGSNSKSPYTNHDQATRIKSISGDGQTLTVTNAAGTNWWAEVTQNLWAYMQPGNGNGGYDAVRFILGSGVEGPTNCVIVNNILTNLSGAAFSLNGESNVISDNWITRVNGYYALIARGRHQTIRNNVWIDSPNIIWFSDSETANITHPGDGSFYDRDTGLYSSQATGTTNILFERNYVINFHQQLGVLSKQSQTGVGGFIVRSNVFVGIKSLLSANADWVGFTNNTYYRVAYESSHVIGAGGFDVNNKQTNLSIVRDAYIDCGRSHAADNGWYSTIDTVDMLLTNNFVCGPEAAGWHAKTTTPSNHITFNGGDPILLNPSNPLGPDRLAFTDDDGLKPLTNSPLAINGVGALTPVTVTPNQPQAHFSVVQSTWLDYIYTNFSTAWVALEPPDRGDTVRPYTTPDPICNVPGEIKFTATNSLTGNSSRMSIYAWDFGDGYLPMVSTNAEVWHRFGRPGTFTVTLRVTNSVGNSSVYSNAYRILDSTNFNGGAIYYVATNGNDLDTGLTHTNAFLTLDKAVSVMAASNYVMVLQGVYTNNPPLDLDRNVAASEADRVRWISYGARIPAIEIDTDYMTVDGFEVTEVPFTAAIHVFLTGSYSHIQNNWLHNFPDPGTKRGIFFDSPPAGIRSPHLDQIHCIISNNFLDQIHYVNIDIQGSNSIVTRNIVLNTGTNGSTEGDVVRLSGTSHTFSFNYASNIFGGHADCWQFFGTNSVDTGWYGKNMIIEGNIFHGTTNGSGTSICQMENDPLGTNYIYEPQSSTIWTNWIIRNNQFLEIPGAGSVDFDGFKFYNNLFYKCRTNGGAPIALGGPKGSSYGTEFKNNVFFACGSDSQGGWYPRTNDQPGITWNVTIDADYNFVCKADLTAYTQAPPSADYSFKSDNQDPNGVNGGDPKFISAAGFNFHLQTGSVLLDEGTTLSGFSTDAEGVTRPQGSAWDIGPFEGESSALPSSKIIFLRGVNLRGTVIR